MHNLESSTSHAPDGDGPVTWLRRKPWCSAMGTQELPSQRSTS